ncbi:MAG: tetratricopeptide repeat protein [Pirellulales bacterium]|nr:tetratricopeptide repeat protein [Pirellulales bacterium]
MKKLNVRLLAILVGTALVLTVTVLVVRHFQVRRHAKTDLENARTINKLEKLEERAEAVKPYVRYLGWFPKETEARAELGLLLADMSKEDPSYLFKAYGHLQQVLLEDTMRDDVRRSVIDLAMRMGRFGDARAQIEVLQNRSPNDGELFELLARCQIAEKDYAAARRSYETAISYAPELLEAYVGLTTLLRTHAEELKYSASVGDTNGATEGAAPSQDATNGAAQNADATNAPEKKPAESTAGDAMAIADDAETDRSEAKNPAKDGVDERDSADYWIDKMVERNPKVSKAYLLRAEYYRRMRRLDAAQGDAAMALQLAPDDQESLLLMAQIAIDQNHHDEARRHVERVVELYPDSAEAYQKLSNIERQSGDPALAAEWLDKGLTATKGHPMLLWEKANLLIGEGKLDQVQPIINQIANTQCIYREPALMNYLAGRLAFAQKEWATASTYFEQSRTDLDRFSHSMARQAAANLAECYEKLNRREMAASLRRELRQTARVRTSGDASWQDYLAAGRLPEAIAKCREQLKRDNASPTLQIDLAKLLILYNERLPVEDRRWTEAEEALVKAGELNPDNAELPILRGRLLLLQRRLGEAREFLEKAVKRDPTRWELWDPLVILAQTDEEWDRAAKLLDEAERHVAAKTSIYLARARLAVLRDGEKATEELKQLADKANEMADSEQSFYCRMMAYFCLRAKDFELAKELCRKVAEKDPTNLQIRVLLFEIANELRDQASMTQAIDEIGRIEQKGPLWHYYTARALVLFNENEDKDKNFKEAIAHLNEARLARPEWPDAFMLLAKIQEQMGDKDAALENYVQAIALGSTDTMGMGRASQLLYEEGRVDEANQILGVLEKSKAAMPTTAILQRGLHDLGEGKIEQGTADLARVAKVYSEQAAESKDYRQYQSLSRILRTLGRIARFEKRDAEASEKYGEAEAALRQAVQLSPKTSVLWIELVTLLSEAGRVRDVSSVLEQAKKQLPPDEVALTLARCYEALGRSTEAEGQYEKAAEESKNNKDLARLTARFYLLSDDDRKKEKGESILREMIDGKRPTNDADVSWARRQLAARLAAHGDHRSYHQAMELIDANLKESPESVLDRRLKARLLSRRPSRAQRKQAQAIFEELVQLPKPSSSDRYELAMLYFADEQWNKASQQMQPLLAAKQVRPEWLDFYIRAQVRMGEYDGAEAKLNRYEQMVEDPFPIAVRRARIFLGRKRHDRAIQVMKDYVEKGSSQFATRPTRLRQAAQSLDNLATRVTGPGRDAATEQYLKQAEAFLREYVQLDPDNTTLLVSFLGRHGQREEALRIAEETWEKNQPVLIAIPTVALLVLGDPSPKEIQRVDKILDGAIRKNQEQAVELKAQMEKHAGGEKDSRTENLEQKFRVSKAEEKALLLSLAELRSIQKHYDEAETLYRKVLEKDPENILALNNLAVFLALRGLKLDESLEMINKTIELAGPAPTLLDSRAMIHLAKGESQKALDDLSMAIGDEPTGIRYFHQAQAFAAAGEKEKAAAAMREADSYGLKAEQLQPLERPAYRKLKEELP